MELRGLLGDKIAQEKKKKREGVKEKEKRII